MSNRMSSTIEDPELEEATDAPEDGDGDEGDGDAPGWLVTYADGKQPEVIRLEDTPDAEVTHDEVLERFDRASKGGAHFFALGAFRGNMSMIRSLNWSENVELPEIAAFDGLQERVEGILEAVEEAARGTVFLQQQQVALQQAQAQLFQAIEAGEGDEPEEEAPEPAPRQLRPQGQTGKGSGKLPPGVRR
jgi:hypothetical protein